MNLILCLLPAFLAAHDYYFTDVAVYGAERALVYGLGPITDQIKIESPLRKGHSDKDLAWGSARLNNEGAAIASYDNRAVVCLLRDNVMIYPDNLKNKNREISHSLHEKEKMGKVRSGDVIVIYVPHSTHLETERAEFYKQFNKRAMSTTELVRHYVDKYVQNNNALSHRFTLVTATVQHYDSAITRHRYTQVAGPELSKNDSDNAQDAPLSFQGSIYGSQVSPGRPINPNFGQTQVAANQAFVPLQPQQYNQPPTFLSSPPQFQAPVQIVSQPRKQQSDSNMFNARTTRK